MCIQCILGLVVMTWTRLVGTYGMVDAVSVPESTCMSHLDICDSHRLRYTHELLYLGQECKSVVTAQICHWQIYKEKYRSRTHPGHCRPYFLQFDNGFWQIIELEPPHTMVVSG